MCANLPAVVPQRAQLVPVKPAVVLHVRTPAVCQARDDKHCRFEAVLLHHRWHVVEAKGRSNPYSQDLIDDAKRQASRIVSVSGQTPVTHSACVASLWKQPRQPREKDIRGKELFIEGSRHLQWYAYVSSFE